MQALVSCRHCKRGVLMTRATERRDLLRLRDHLADCRPDDPSEALDDADVLRLFRVVPIPDLGHRRGAHVNAGPPRAGVHDAIVPVWTVSGPPETE